MFTTSNNEAKYEAFIADIKLYYMAGATSVRAYSDSQLVVS